MKPLSVKKRISYIVLLILVFIVAAPLLIFYASGYRLDSAFKFATTGGLYISAEQSGFEIYLEDRLVRKTSIFQKSVFVQNLKPESYNVLVKKEGYQIWEKTLKVFPETVTEAYPFNFPVNVIATEIPQKISQPTQSNATATEIIKTIENPDYVNVVSLFKDEKIAPTPSKVSTSTKDIKEFRKLLVENVKGVLKISWTGEPDSKPGYFCQNEVCKEEVIINPASKLKNFDFFPGRDDLIIMSLVDGIYVTEIDDRSKQNIQKLFDGPNADFRIMDGNKIYISKDKKFYSLAL